MSETPTSEAVLRECWCPDLRRPVRRCRIWRSKPLQQALRPNPVRLAGDRVGCRVLPQLLDRARVARHRRTIGRNAAAAAPVYGGSYNQPVYAAPGYGAPGYGPPAYGPPANGTAGYPPPAYGPPAQPPTYGPPQQPPTYGPPQQPPTYGPPAQQPAAYAPPPPPAQRPTGDILPNK
jgi:hypothetical protein